ncbi:MAG TPA: hypothetical protein DCQ41_01465 [Cryomorphaceae bacterium]|nr:hypothetical protein [Cryomorphaceae bacterium]
MRMSTNFDSTYLTDKHWYIPYSQLKSMHDWEIIGYSSEERPLLSTSLGQGSRSICIWAGMHGNETTGIFIILSLIELFQKKQIDLEGFTLHLIPVVNPDAYVRYSRRNGLGIDLNRDFASFQTIESAKLLGWIKMHEPELCFNLHDQRTIFHVGGRSAYTSLLVPSADITRQITPIRRDLMNRLGNALTAMQLDLAGIGRYTDEYYPTAIGDYLMANGIPNILIESGVKEGDLERRGARKFGLLTILATIRADVGSSEVYEQLPLNEKGQLEWVFTNVLYAHMRVDVAIKRFHFVNGHAADYVYLVDEIGDLKAKPRMKQVDGTAIALAAPLELEKPVNGHFGNYLFEEGKILTL